VYIVIYRQTITAFLKETAEFHDDVLRKLLEDGMEPVRCKDNKFEEIREVQGSIK
jgi:hypothetical protein